VEPSSWADEYKRIFKLFEGTLKWGFGVLGYSNDLVHIPQAASLIRLFITT
jgi:hypothetical protein